MVETRRGFLPGQALWNLFPGASEECVPVLQGLVGQASAVW